MLKVVCALIIRNEKVLVVQNNANSDHDLLWEFAGGKIKNGETAEEAVKREIEEELELKITILNKLESTEFDYGFKQIQLIPFLCSIKSGELKLNEHRAFRWVNSEELAGIDFSGADRELLQNEANSATLKKYVGKEMNHPR